MLDRIEAGPGVGHELEDTRAVQEGSPREEALATSDARHAFLLQLSDALRPMDNPAEVQAEAGRRLGRHLGVGRVLYGEVEPDGIHIRFERNHVAPGVAPVTGRFRMTDFGSWLPGELSSGRTVVVPDVGTEARLGTEERSSYAAVSIGSLVAVPLHKGGRFVAALVVHHPGPRRWVEPELALLEEVAERTWEAVERARAEKALRASEARFRTLVENIRDYAIYGIDPSGFVTDWTEGAGRVKGYAAEEVIGRHASMFYAPEDRERGVLEQELEQAARFGRSERETWKVRRNGERFWANEITTAIRDAAGSLIGFTRISRDLTIQRRAQQEREAQLERERHGREAAEAFLAVMSHELRTPVTSIYGSASLLARDPRRADAPELVADMLDESDRLMRIIDDLLVLSGVDRGLLQLAPEPVLLQHAIRETVADVERRFPSAAFEVDVPPDLAPVMVDVTALRQVLYNLLSNGAKYAGTAGPIRVTAVPMDGTTEIGVHDDGPGLGPDPVALFDLFYRSPETARQASGTGIGLYVVRELLHAMGSTIRAGTREGGGASFRFTLRSALGDDA